MWEVYFCFINAGICFLGVATSYLTAARYKRRNKELSKHNDWLCVQIRKLDEHWKREVLNYQGAVKQAAELQKELSQKKMEDRVTKTAIDRFSSRLKQLETY